MSFDSLHFPACASCNSQFSQAERRVKRIVEKMLNAAELSSQEIHSFLDWLDKVRTGLWLGALYMGKNLFGIKPIFHISSRVGGKDRMMVIYRSPVGAEGLFAIGFSTPLFLHHPVCFSLWINHLCFLNVSTDFLISRRLGFPYPTQAFESPAGLIGYEMAPGRERVLFPLMKFRYTPGGSEIFQPMFHHRLSHEMHPNLPRLYETDYVRRNSLFHDLGIGKPLIQDGRSLKPYPENPSSEWLPSQKSDFLQLLKLSVEQTLEIQVKLVKDTPVPKQARMKFAQLKNANLTILKEFRKNQV